MKSLGSVIGSLPTLKSNPTGTPNSASGTQEHANLPTLIEGENLQQQDAEETDKALLARLSLLLGRQPDARRQSLNDDGYGYTPVVVGYDLPTMTRDQAGAALALVIGTMEPASNQEIGKALAMLKSVTARRNEADADSEFAADVFLEELERYPRDVALDAMRRWRRREKWFPTLAEIIAECDKLNRPRKALRFALETIRQ